MFVNVQNKNTANDNITVMPKCRMQLAEKKCADASFFPGMMQEKQKRHACPPRIGRMMHRVSVVFVQIVSW
jgi:hypothetical protein